MTDYQVLQHLVLSAFQALRACAITLAYLHIYAPSGQGIVSVTALKPVPNKNLVMAAIYAYFTISCSMEFEIL